MKVPLSAVVLQVLHEKICTKMLKGYPWDRTTHTMLCAGGEDKVSSYTCHEISAKNRSIGSTTGCTITEKATTRAFSWLKAPKALSHLIHY